MKIKFVFVLGVIAMTIGLAVVVMGFSGKAAAQRPDPLVNQAESLPSQLPASAVRDDGSMAAIQPDSPAPTFTTWVIQYQDSTVLPGLMQILGNLQAAGQVGAIDAESKRAADNSPGHIFVLGKESAVLALRGLSGIVAIQPAPLADEITVPPSTLEASPLEATGAEQVFLLSLDPTLPAAEQTRLAAHLDALRASGKISNWTSAGLTLRVTTLSASREALAGLPGVVVVSEESGQREANETDLLANGFITGLVTADDGGVPISHVGACAYQSSPYVYQCDNTDVTGVYSISVPAGNYQVRFYSPDYHIGEYYDDVPFDLYNSYTPVSVSDGAVTPNINAGLAPGAQIVGHVTDGANPLPGISIDVSDRASYYVYGYTGANGVYTTSPGLPSGDYFVQFRDGAGVYAAEYYDDKFLPSQATAINVTTTNRTGVNAVLSAAAVVTGTVSGSGPLSGAYVYAYYADENEYVNSVSTDALGHYRMAGLSPVPHKVWFYDSSGQYISEWHQDKLDWYGADPVPLTSGVTTTIDAQLALAGAITGTVTAEGGGPLFDIRVNAYDATTSNSMGSDRTDAAGVYRIGGLAAGAYKLRFRDDTGVYLGEYYNNKPDFASGDPVAVASGMTTTVNVQLAQAGVITGTVTAEGSGLPLNTVGVTAYDAATGNYKNSGATNAGGVYRIVGLAAGHFKLRFVDNAGLYLTEYYDNKPDLAAANWITVANGMTTTIDAALAAGGRLTGRVTDIDTGMGIEGVSIYVSRLDAKSSSGSATTNASGYYTTTALPTGVYKVSFDPPLPYYDETYDNFRSGYGFTPVSVVAPTATVDINAALRAGYLISGTVTGPGPLSSVFVAAYRGVSSSYQAYAYTNSSGQYRLGPLAPGSYRVKFQPSDLHASEWYSDSLDYVGSTVINLAGNTPNINADLQMGQPITGTVTGPGGTPLSNVWVYVYPAGGSNSVASDYTDADGQYATMPGLVAGSFQVYFSAPEGYASEWYDNQSNQANSTVITKTAGVAKTNVNAQLAGLSGGVISGRVTAVDSGLPLSTWVYAYNSVGDSVKSAYSSGGMYTLRHLPPGVYRLRFSAAWPYVQRYYSNQADLASASPVTVTVGMTVTDINQALPRGGRITGAVTGSGGVPGVYVYTRRISGGSLTQSIYTGVDGNYLLDGLDTGVYKVQFSPPPPFMGEWYNDAPNESAAITVSVQLNVATPNIDVSLATGGVITGMVTAADTGLPLSGASADIYQAPAGAWFIGSIYANMDGFYQTPGLPVGDYKVSFYRGPWSEYIEEWYNDAPYFEPALTVTVPVSGVVPDINVALERGGSISGRLYDAATGYGLPGTYANAYTALTYAYEGYGYSNNEGFYMIGGLPSDGYKIYVSRSGYQTQWYSNTRDFSSAVTVTVNAPNDTPGINVYLRPFRYVYLPLILRTAP